MLSLDEFLFLGDSSQDESVKPPPFNLSESDRDFYSIIGYFTSKIADLEYVIDEFTFKVSEKYPNFSKRLSTNFPIKMEEKVDFLMGCYVLMANLREIGDGDGIIDLKYIFYSLEEIRVFRNHCIHGRLDYIESENGRFQFKSSRYARLQKNKYEISTFKVGQGYFEYLLEKAAYVKSQLRTGIEILDGKNIKARQDEIMRGQANLREIKRILGDRLIIAPKSSEKERGTLFS